VEGGGTEERQDKANMPWSVCIYSFSDSDRNKIYNQQNKGNVTEDNIIN
jgi:hypothetical protein